MRCRVCKKNITGKEGKDWYKVKNDEGRVKHLLCNKCMWIDKKKERYTGREKVDLYKIAGEYRNKTDVELEARQQEIAEQTALEPRPESWDDHRDPTEVEL